MPRGRAASAPLWAGFRSISPGKSSAAAVFQISRHVALPLTGATQPHPGPYHLSADVLTAPVLDVLLWSALCVCYVGQVGLVFQFPERHFLGDDVMQEMTFTWPRAMSHWGQRQAMAVRMQQVRAFTWWCMPGGGVGGRGGGSGTTRPAAGNGCAHGAGGVRCSGSFGGSGRMKCVTLMEGRASNQSVQACKVH